MSIYGDRELDVRVALALGWVWVNYEGERGIIPSADLKLPKWSLYEGGDIPLAERWDHFLIGYPLPEVATCPIAIFGLLEEMAKPERGGWSYSIEGDADRKRVRFWRLNDDPGVIRVVDGDRASAPTLGEAVCLAVLAALGESGAKEEA